MQDIISEIESLLKNACPKRMSFFQLKHFIVDIEPTNQAKLQVCLRELRTRCDSLKNIQKEHEEISDKNELASIELQRLAYHCDEEDTFGIKVSSDEEAILQQKERAIVTRQLNRKIDDNKKKIEELKETAKNINEEAQFFIQAFNQLVAIEPLKVWDDLDVQKQYWDSKIGNMLKLRLILGLPLDEELIKSALALPTESETRKKTENLLAATQQQIEQEVTAEIKLKE